MKHQVVWAVCLTVCLVAAQYGPPPTKNKKHRTTTTTTETPGSISNEIAGPFPSTDTGLGASSGTGSYSFAGSSASASSSGQPGGNVVTGSNYWWSGPGSPFKPDSQPNYFPPQSGPVQPPVPQPPSNGCGGPAGCTGVGTDPRPLPEQPASKPVDIAQNPFLNSAINGKPIQPSPQGCQSFGGTCQYPPGNVPQNSGQPPQYQGTPDKPSFYPQPTGPSQYPGQPQAISPSQNPGQPQPTIPNQYPGQTKPTGPSQYPGQPRPTGSTQYPGQQQPSGPIQYPGEQQPTGPLQYPGQPQPTGPSQYPGPQPTVPNQYPGQPQTTGPNQYPGQPQSTGPNTYPGQPRPTGPNQYPGQPQSTGPNTYPGQPQTTGPNQYPGYPQSTGPNKYPGQPQTTGPNQYPRQPQPSEPSPYHGQPQPQPSGQQSVPLRPQCTLEGHACVPSSMCVGGVITPNGLRQMRDPQVKECIPGLEACCKILSPAGGTPPFSASQRPSYEPVTQKPYTGPLNTTPYPGCAAALKCVAETYCTAEGVMSDAPVVLTREQAENKVPLTDCQDLETGIIGKCCRDPNYSDPWPGGMMMMMKNPGDFDDGQYHGEGSEIGVNTGSSYNTIPSVPQSPSKDHGPKPLVLPGGYQKPFPPPFPGNVPSSPPYTPIKPQQPSPYQPSKPSSTGPSNQPAVSPYQPSQPTPPENHPFGAPYQPDRGSQTGPNKPEQPSGAPLQPAKPSYPTYQPPTNSYEPGSSSTAEQTYQPGQPTPPKPVQPGQQTGYNLPTHPGQNQPSSAPQPQDQGPVPGSSCGIRRPGPAGDVAGFAEFPWQALVMSAGNRSLLCGAAIIAENAVITAAHCVDQLKAKDLLVKAGEWKLLGQNPKPVQVRPVVVIARHPAYDRGSLAKDLTILLVAEPFTFDSHVDQICVPPELGSEYFQKPGQNCVITGWGKNALQGPVQGSELHKVDVSVVPAKQCEAKLKTSQNLGKYFILNEGFSCALPPSATDLCKVDFGSAVACERGDGYYELAGVNSWDIACPTGQQLPSVFATSDASWINTVLNTPLSVLQAEENNFNQGLNQGESIAGIDVDDKPGFSQGYGK